MNSPTEKYSPRLIAWEVTRRCYLSCKHCRAAACDKSYQGEFSTDEIRATLENIASFAKPIIILTGGEPMMRDDIYDIASFGDSLGLRMVMAPCGRLVTAETVTKMKEAGIRRISLSIDGRDAASHDAFRGLAGSFADAINAAKLAKDGGMPFQINTTVTKANVGQLADILQLSKDLGAVSFHPFLLVPTGRGKNLTGLELSPREYEETLAAVHEMSRAADIHVKPTCAPHYFRISKQRGDKPTLQSEHHRHGGHGHPGGLDSATRGCLGGTGFAFISHTGSVQICGFLDVPCGDVREANYDFAEIWNTSSVFRKMRDRTTYKGKCGICGYHDLCGGCRARAYAMTGDYMKPEPYCIYMPQNRGQSPKIFCENLGEQTPPIKRTSDEAIITDLQNDLPITPNPFGALATKYSLTEDKLLEKMVGWHEAGLIRHLSAHVDAKRLDFASALVAMAVPSEGIDRATTSIASHPGISHCYQRDHRYNVWFTIKVPATFNLSDHIERIAALSHAKDFLVLPSTRTFKLNVKFDATAKQSVGNMSCIRDEGDVHDLSPADWTILETLNRGLPIAMRPFDTLAASLDLDVGELCRRIAGLKNRGAFEKLRFVVNHNKLGIAANAMVVWDVEESRVDDVGARFAEKDFISHCYSRTRYDAFPYNMYTMIHAGDATTLDELVASLASEIGKPTHLKLTTLRELIKRKATLECAEYRRWEESPQ